MTRRAAADGRNIDVRAVVLTWTLEVTVEVTIIGVGLGAAVELGKINAAGQQSQVAKVPRYLCVCVDDAGGPPCPLNPLMTGSHHRVHTGGNHFQSGDGTVGCAGHLGPWIWGLRRCADAASRRHTPGVLIMCAGAERLGPKRGCWRTRDTVVWRSRRLLKHDPKMGVGTRTANVGVRAASRGKHVQG
jgi:hypothetical protein